MFQSIAQAKVNLNLHITGKRSDGYHSLESLVVFAEYGDVLTYTPGPSPLSVTFSGRFSTGLDAHDNSLIKTADFFHKHSGMGVTGRLNIEKNIPVQAGLGGGTADSAAFLRILSRYFALDVPGAAMALTLGADVPISLYGKPAIMRATGADITPVQSFPAYGIVLANPGIAIETKAAFQELNGKFSPPLPEKKSDMPWQEWLSATHNSFEGPIAAKHPAIADMVTRLREHPNTQFATMTGSGASCIALTAGLDEAKKIARDYNDMPFIVASEI